ncbi:putative O-methyltransferase [Aspergillus affinis]|uniref:putative O-methyltransferase n=1 Tax=Aspergillus affinis TaxID=1070780 RepID=UPI0022FE43C8|nr:putative O-methyltransferase [Aspergillus affinis]KAI9036835.1 putative O-methyltransferase [Aspergillus affinis]
MAWGTLEMPTLTELAEEALAHARRLDAYTAAQGLPPVSLADDTLTSAQLPADLETARSALVDSAQMMKRLAQGPLGNMTEILYSFTDIISLQAVHTYDLPAQVPESGTASYADIARAVSLPESICRRLMVHAMENGIFEEVEGCVKHSAFSRMLAVDRESMQAVGMVLMELLPAGHRTLDALTRFPGSQKPTETGFNLANDTPLPLYKFLSQHPERLARFGMGMKFFSRADGFDLKFLAMGFPWREIDREDAVVVDCGGGVGTVSRHLATATEKLQFVVQDMAGPVALGRDTLPVELQGRVRFEEADFFTPQKLIGANVYFFRWILHNWSDAYCVRILRNLVPAMHAHSKVVIYEYILAEQPELKWSRKQGRNLDLVMMAGWNAEERSLSQLRQLFAQADERFELEGSWQPEGSTMTAVSFGWKGTKKDE